MTSLFPSVFLTSSGDAFEKLCIFSLSRLSFKRQLFYSLSTFMKPFLDFLFIWIVPCCLFILLCLVDIRINISSLKKYVFVCTTKQNVHCESMTYVRFCWDHPIHCNTTPGKQTHTNMINTKMENICIKS